MQNSKAAPVVPGKHLTFISTSVKYWKIIEKLRPFFAYHLMIYIIHLFMRGLKNVHFLERTKDGNKYMAGWVKYTENVARIKKNKSTTYNVDQPWET